MGGYGIQDTVLIIEVPWGSTVHLHVQNGIVVQESPVTQYTLYTSNTVHTIQLLLY